MIMCICYSEKNMEYNASRSDVNQIPAQDDRALQEMENEDWIIVSPSSEETKLDENSMPIAHRGSVEFIEIFNQSSSSKIIPWDEFDFENNPEVQNILSDFQTLDFLKNPCDDPTDDINFNEGKEANPFDKIAKYYGRKKNVFLFIATLRNEKMSKKIIEEISKKCDDEAREKFVKRMNIYLDRICKGERHAMEFLNNDKIFHAFFNGPHVGENRNIHQNLNIDTTENRQTLETSRFFNTTPRRVEEEKSEVTRAKIYNNGQRIMTVEKHEKHGRNYSYTKHAICDTTITWRARDGAGKDVNCMVCLQVNAGQMNIVKSAIDNVSVGLKEVLELSKQNVDVLIKGNSLHDVLKRCSNM